MRKLGLTLLVVLFAGVVLAAWIATSRAASRAAPASVHDAPVTQADDGASRGAHVALQRPSDLAARPDADSTPAPTHEHDAQSSARAGVELAATATERAEAAVHAKAHVWGRVRDADSLRPVPGTALRFTCGAQTLAELRAPEDGRFRTEFDVVGPCRVEVEPPEGWLVHSGAEELDAEQIDGVRAVEVLVRKASASVAGDIHGYLQSESGEWMEETLPKRGAVLVDLVQTREPRQGVRAEITQAADATGRITLEFRFRDVAPGDYELTVSGVDGLRWAPSSMRVAPPADGLSFVRFDKEHTLPLAFEVFDARTREPIREFRAWSVKLTPSKENGVFFHSGPIDLGTFALQEAFSWSLAAPGYAPAFGDASAFTTEGERRVARVYLARGWATRVLALARDPAARPAVNAEVHADGVFVGRTGADGTLVVRLAEKPRELDVRYAGFERAESAGTHDLARYAQTTIVYLERRR